MLYFWLMTFSIYCATLNLHNSLLTKIDTILDAIDQVGAKSVKRNVQMLISKIILRFSSIKTGKQDKQINRKTDKK